MEVHGDAKEVDRLVEVEEQLMEEEAARSSDVIIRANTDDAEVEEELREEMEEQVSVIEEVLNSNVADTRDAVAAAQAASAAEETEMAEELMEEEIAIQEDVSKAMADGSVAEMAEEEAMLEAEVKAEEAAQASSAMERAIEAEEALDELSEFEVAKVPAGDLASQADTPNEFEELGADLLDADAATSEPVLLDQIEEDVFGDQPDQPVSESSEATALDNLLGDLVDEQIAKETTTPRMGEDDGLFDEP